MTEQGTTKALSIAAMLFLAGCGGPVDCRTDSSVARAKGVEILMEKPGGRVEPWDYQWAQNVRKSYPQCWDEVER
jgi:hypothetical protein